MNKSIVTASVLQAAWSGCWENVKNTQLASYTMYVVLLQTATAEWVFD